LRGLSQTAELALVFYAEATTNAYQQDPGSSIGLSWQFEY
jgi:hypothetical protein